ncbi:MAG TPA: PD-(D/E)XK nuclease family protein, partial [Myxococcota bacterium]|nr:PD-(D/E)XK nuclease family protein [Myxococcota bacterium]
WGVEIGLWWDDFVQRMDSGLATDPRDIPVYLAALDGTVFWWIENNKYIEFGKWYEDVRKKFVETSALLPNQEQDASGKKGKKEQPKVPEIDDCERIINWFDFRSSPDDPCWQDKAILVQSFGDGRCSARKAVNHCFTPVDEAKKDPIAAWENKINKDVREFIGKIKKLFSRAESSWLSSSGRYVAGVEFKIGSRSSPLPLKLSDDLTINIYGSVDRLEYDDVRNRLNICDYKTGSPKNTSTLTSEILSGTHLQLPLYAIAVDQMIGDALPLIKKTRVGAIRLEAVRRNSKGERPVCALRPDAPCGDSGLSVVDCARVRAAQAVNGVESGRFPIQRLRTGFESQADEVVRVLLLVDPPPLGDGGSAPDGVMAGDGSEGGEVTE